MKINIMAFFLAAVLSFIFMPLLKTMLMKTSLLSKNYLGEDIPNGMGIGIIFAQILSLGIISLFFKDLLEVQNIYLIGFVLIGFLGLLDDTIGTDEYKGFKGHIGAFFKGKLTTGNIKASLGLFIALYVSLNITDNIISVILNTVLIALFTNLMNLFDLRPGRAIKVFLILSILNLFLVRFSNIDYIVFSLYGILLAYMRIDLKAFGMMGDTGSNILGYTLGYYAACNFDNIYKVIIIGLLVFTNLLSEKVSFSKIIENNKLLNFIDRLGR